MFTAPADQRGHGSGSSKTSHFSTDHQSCVFLFNDDSSLLSCVKMSKLLLNFGIWSRFGMLSDPKRPSLSPRQIEYFLGREPDFIAPASAFQKRDFLEQFEYVYSAKYTKSFRELLRSNSWDGFSRRPCFISAFPGLELLPDDGIPARSVADVRCFNNTIDLDLHHRRARPERRPDALRFSPLLYTENPAPLPPTGAVRRLVFLTQSALPAVREGREHIIDMLNQISLRNPSCEVLVKLRHVSGENRFHTHREYIPYQKMLEDLDNPQIRIVDGHMEDVLLDADATLTCSSTAGLEGMTFGVPAMYYTSYPMHKLEHQFRGTRRLFKGSNLEVSQSQLLNLEVPKIDTQWWSDNFTGPRDLDLLVSKMREKARNLQRDCRV